MNTIYCRSAVTFQLIFKGLLAGLLSMLFVFPGFSQESQSGIDALMDEIVVTARKREENVQNTPIAVSAFSGESLAARGIDQLDGIGTITPNMTFSNINTNGGSNNNVSVYIRGVGQTDHVPTTDAGVGLYVDGNYLARSVGSVLDLIDIERVEVLRGPQGTLFGRNTIGGAVNIHTVKPHEEFEVKLRGKVGSDDRMDLMAKVNGALAENLFASVTLATLNQDGYVVNPITGQDTNDDDTLAFRGALRWLVNNDVEINITGDYSRDRENGQGRVTDSDTNNLITFSGPTSPSSVGSAPFGHNVFLGINSPIPQFALPPGRATGCDATFRNPAGTNANCVNFDTIGIGQNTSGHPQFYDADIYGISGTIDWAITDNMSIRSITAYRKLDSNFSQDGDYSPFFLSYIRDEFKQEQISQELQLQGNSFGDRLKWILGFYYFNEDGVNNNAVDFVSLDIESGGYFDNESKAGFAQATYDITEKLHLTAGIRYTKDNKEFIVVDGQQVVVPIFAPGQPTFQIIPLGTYTANADDWTPMVNLSYDWNDSLMTYATYSEGFKGGGFQQRIAGELPGAPSYDPEFVDSYEIGFKYSSSNDSFILNAAAFYADYTDIQLEVFRGIAPILENAGEAEVKGFELEARWVPVDTWFVEAAIGHLDANITKADPAATAIGGPADGDRLPHVPRWTGSASIIKEFGLGDMGTLTPRVDWTFRSKVFFGGNNADHETQKSYSLYNANIAWNSADEKYALTFYVNNIGDLRYVHYNELANSAGVGSEVLARDREWYLTGEVRF